MDIRKISYESAELFLSANDRTIPNDNDELYREVEKLLNVRNIFIPDEIVHYLNALHLKSVNLMLPKYYTHYILSATFDELIPIAQRLKLTSVNKEQIQQILFFLGIFDDEIAYLENLRVDILIHIFRHLNNKDIVFLCNSSNKIKKTFVDNRFSFFPQLKDLSLCKNLNDDMFFKSFDRCLKYASLYNNIFCHRVFYKFEKNTYTSYQRYYETPDNDSQTTNFKIIRKTVNTNRNIIQMARINHILYFLLDDGTIINNNEIDGQEFVSIHLENCLHITTDENKLLIVVLNGDCYEWDGELRKLSWIKDVIKVCDEIHLTIDGTIYRNQQKIDFADKIVDMNGLNPLMVSSQGAVFRMEGNDMVSIGDCQNIVKINYLYLFVIFLLDKDGNVFNFNQGRSRRRLSKVDYIYINYNQFYGLYYIQNGMLNHIELDEDTADFKGSPVSIPL